MNWRYWWKPVVGAAAGAGLGAAYSYYVGCLSGGCPITSRWELMALMGAALGWSFFAGKKPEPEQQETSP